MKDLADIMYVVRPGVGPGGAWHGRVCNETHDKTHYKECSVVIRLFIQP